MRRRDFLVRLSAGGGALLIAEQMRAQQPSAPPQGATSNLFDMDQSAAKSARRPPKPGAKKSMTDDERDAVEREIRCQCGCTLDVYICRTTDFSCQVSPAMHRDVISLVEGGHSAQEIVDAFVETYGERALMSPKREGFNWAAYLLPFAAIGVGGVVLANFLRGMQQRSAAASAGVTTVRTELNASDDELARLQAAIRRDD